MPGDGGNRVRVGVKPGQWGWSFDELTVAWERIEALGFDVLSCFDHVSARPAGYAAWDAPTLLAAMAGRTRRVVLSVDVINISLRHPFLLAGQLAVAQAASGGRLEVGLGAGSYGLARHDHETLGIPFPKLLERTARLDACARALPSLWRGESVTDESLGLEQASLGPLGIAIPPLIIGGTSAAVMEIAARHGDGWNMSIQNAGEYAEHARLVEELCARLERRRPLLRHVQVFADALTPTQARETLGQLVDHGATTVVFVFHGNRDLAAIERLADQVVRT
jgi:alkanesulfonate monooxygenase SsuD/methylene tetrahydromethanopterin reductase-like flavin-dependent oxidoreductase (luciferase family)